MQFIEHIGEEIATKILIAIVSAVIVYFAWRSTSVRDEILPTRAVLIIENSRRSFFNLTGDRELASSSGRSSSSQSNPSNTTDEVDIDNEEEDTQTLNELEITEQPTTSVQAIIHETNDITGTRIVAASSSASTAEYHSQPGDTADDIDEMSELDSDEAGRRRIIDRMDTQDSAEGLRRRRLVFFERQSQERQGGTTSQLTIGPSTSPNRILRENLNVNNEQLVDDTTDNSHAENCSNENNENENISKTVTQQKAAAAMATTSPLARVNQSPGNDEFRIKLKYLNDDLRLVKGTPSEAIGDFKKRNFTAELAAQKQVRLVFNGHVLQPDLKTLEACGLFDNCVVHCLIHNKKPALEVFNSTGDRRSQTINRRDTNQAGGIGTATFSERSNNGPLFVYLGMCFVTLVIVFLWYYRFQYGYLFSWYSTSGLVLLTVLLIVMFPLIILIEREVTS